MKYKIEKISEIILIGKRVRMSIANNKTTELWQRFMPLLNSIKNKENSHLFSVEIYNDPSFFKQFDPHKVFEKWAAVRILNKEDVPDNMNVLTIPEGDYVVFDYKGRATDAPKAYQYIFATWIPDSEYLLDDRPHFAVMGEKYIHNHPESEEELWIPIRPKNT